MEGRVAYDAEPRAFSVNRDKSPSTTISGAGVIFSKSRSRSGTCLPAIARNVSSAATNASIFLMIMSTARQGFRPPNIQRC